MKLEHLYNLYIILALHRRIFSHRMTGDMKRVKEISNAFYDLKKGQTQVAAWWSGISSLAFPFSRRGLSTRTSDLRAQASLERQACLGSSWSVNDGNSVKRTQWAVLTHIDSLGCLTGKLSRLEHQMQRLKSVSVHVRHPVIISMDKWSH